MIKSASISLVFAGLKCIHYHNDILNTLNRSHKFTLTADGGKKFRFISLPGLKSYNSNSSVTNVYNL